MEFPALTTKTAISALKQRVFPRADLSGLKPNSAGDISSVFSSLKDGAIDSSLLPQSYASIKQRLVKDPTAIKASWVRLKAKLAAEIDKIADQSSKIIPSVEFEELDTLTPQRRAEILKRGCTVVRNVIPKNEARAYKFEIEKYIRDNPHTIGFPRENSVVYELYWSKPQIKARAHPNLMKTTRAMNKFWHAREDTQISFEHNISYSDRLRIRKPGDSMFTLGPHSDAGSIERWEDEEYSNCYQPIWEGRWEDYDPYDATHRVDAKSNMYDSQGNCSMFRTFQGWISLSDIHPGQGTILFAPLVREVTAYLLLKPFFDENDNVVLHSSKFPGAVPGKAQEYSESLHPELQLSRLMTCAPSVHPGDMVFWHCDLIHAVDPKCSNVNDSSVMYIPATPLCNNNTDYAFLQRESFLNKLVAPDFPGFPNGIGESKHVGCAESADVEAAGGREGLESFALEKIEADSKLSSGAKKAVERYNRILFGHE